MAEVKWIKIVTDIFDDDKILLIESLPEADSIIVIWFKLLCLAGKQNNSGVFLLNGRIPYTEEMFATIFRRPLNTVRLALKTFEEFGMIEIVNNAVTIPNWSKHQKLDQIERNREYMKNYMRERRKEQRLLAEGKTNCKTNSESNVSGADKNREDKNREDKNNNNNYNGDGCCDGDSVNPFGDKNVPSPQTDTVQMYAVNNLMSLGHRAMEELNSYVDDLSEDIVRHAIDNALDNGKKTWAYVKAILNSYVDAGVKTVGDAKAADEKHANGRRGKRPQEPPAQHLPFQQPKPMSPDERKELYKKMGLKLG